MTKHSPGIARHLVRRHPGLTLVALPGLVLVIVAGLLWSPGTSATGGARASSARGVALVRQDRAAPSFDLPRLFGSGRLGLRSLRGHVVVVNFWASWCTACRHEVPALVRLARRYRGTDVDFVGIDHGDQGSAARAFARRNGMSYPSVVDESGGLLARYGTVGLPTTYVLGRDGRIRFEAIGAADAAALRRSVDRVRTEHLAAHP